MNCSVNWKGGAKKKRKVKKRSDADLYALLGLQNERWTATDAQMKNGKYVFLLQIRWVGVPGLQQVYGDEH